MRSVRVPSGVRRILYGEPPFGWRLSKDRSRLVLDSDEQRLVAVVRHMYFIERVDMRTIVTRLDEMGVVNRRGRPFGLSSVWGIIHHGTRLPREAGLSNRKK
jgi:hypothetical protein